MDPALQELLLAEEAAEDRVVEAIIRFRRPGAQVPGVRVVASFGRVATCRLRAGSVRAVHDHPDVLSLKDARPLGPEQPDRDGPEPEDADDARHAHPADVRRPQGLPLTGAGVVVGVVDFGLDVDHPSFALPDGSTRLLALWDQRGTGAGVVPAPYGYGRVHDRERIDEALRTPSPYEHLGYEHAAADRGGGTHGTHVTDIAAGNGRAGGPVGVAPEADLVFVHLADRGTAGLRTLGDSVRLLEGVDFVRRTAGHRPWVVNLSVGRMGGPHDGRTLTELALDELLSTSSGCCAVQSAGNYFRARTHASGVVGQGAVHQLAFVTDAADTSVNELEIWYDGLDELAVRVDPPGTDDGVEVALGDRAELVAGGRVAGRIYHRARDPNNGDHHVDAFLFPWAPAGRWTVTLAGRRVSSGRFDAWLERDEACAPCQARFVPADSDRGCTTGTIANGRLPLVVGAYDARDPRRPPTPFSSEGPTRDGRRKPDVAAPGRWVLAARSARPGSRRSDGALVRKSGTSMAAPHVTGAVALCLQAGGHRLDARQIRALVLGTADPLAAGDARHRLGRGYLDIAALVAATLAAFPFPDRSPLPPALAPSRAFRELLYRPDGDLARRLAARFEVLARPGQRVDGAPRAGDVLLQVVPGDPGPGRCSVLAGPALAGNWYAESRGRTRRRVLDTRRRLPPGRLLLRPRVTAEPAEQDGESQPGTPSAACLARASGLKVAVVGGGLGGLLAARTLARWGVKVTVYEARDQVGGRVRSDTTFARGRITEFGAELVGSIHTRWCALAQEYGLSLISRLDGDLYRGQQLAQRMILDRLLTPEEVAEVEKQKVDRVLRPMAELARASIQAGRERDPWNQPGLGTFDRTSVADALEKRFGVGRNERLWKAMELFLVNNNVARLEHSSFLALLCLVRGGQTGRRAGRPVTIAPDPLMGYWDELEIYRCADGCQRLARAVAAEVHATKGCRVVTSMGVRRIELRPPGGGVRVTARSTKDTPFDRWLRDTIPGNPLMDTRRYDCVVLAVPPTVWGDVEITPIHPKDVIGLMGSGPAVKFFSTLETRFWVKDGFAPLGGSLDVGQVWEGTDNQTRSGGQGTVLSVFTGARTPTVDTYKDGLARLYPADPRRRGSGYRANLAGTKLVDWSREPFIRTGYSSPRVGQVLTIGKELNEPFQGRLFFAGEHTEMDHFGYMEGAIRSGERAAALLVDRVCQPVRTPSEPVLVAAAAQTTPRRT